MMERKERLARSPAFRAIYQATEQVCLLLLWEITDKRTYGRTTVGEPEGRVSRFAASGKKRAEHVKKRFGKKERRKSSI